MRSAVKFFFLSYKNKKKKRMPSCNTTAYPVPAAQSRVAQWKHGANARSVASIGRQVGQRPVVRQVVRQAVRQAVRQGQFGEPMPCPEFYQSVVKAACGVGCSLRTGEPDAECQLACVEQTAIDYPQDQWCPDDPADPDPCEDCLNDCTAIYDEFLEQNCPEVCTNDWEGQDCKDCRELGECRWARCLLSDCLEPCADPGGGGDPLSKFKQFDGQRGNPSLSRGRVMTMGKQKTGPYSRVTLAKLANANLARGSVTRF
jgi:hypothetical protein